MKKPKVRVRPPNITSHEHDKQTGTLTARFSSGAVYNYHNVPEDIAAGLSGAGGSYLPRHIAGKFTHKRID